MPFVKGNRIEAKHGGTVITGFVDSIVRGRVVFRSDDGRTFKPQDERVFRASTAPVPADVVVPVEWVKGQRVRFPSDQDGFVHGTVTSAGSKTVKVMADGGVTEYSVPRGLLSPSDKILPPHEPSHMDAWSVASY